MPFQLLFWIAIVIVFAILGNFLLKKSQVYANQLKVKLAYICQLFGIICFCITAVLVLTLGQILGQKG